MRALKPSLKERKRYLLVKGKNLKKNIEKAILNFIGVLGLSKVGLSWIKTTKDSAIICINREMLNKVRASLVIFPQKMTVERVSGTIKGLRK